MRKNLFILLFALMASFCFGQQNFWIKRDTFLTARYLTSDSKGRLYIATSNGLYVMEDTDSDIIKTSLKQENIIRVEVNDRDDVFAIPLNEDMLYYSQDGGDTWTETQLPPSKSEIPHTSEQSVKTFNNSRVQSFFAKGDKIICGGEKLGGIWKSEDLGANWSMVWEASVQTLGVNIIHERSNGDLLAGTSGIIITKTDEHPKDMFENFGIFRSTDGGSSWNYWKPDIGRPDFVFDIVENSKKHLFLGTSFYYPDLNGIFVSNDDGVSWQQTLHDPYGWNVDLAIAPNDVVYAFFDASSPVYRSLFRSFDGGESWSRIHYFVDDYLNERLRSLCVSPDGYLYALSPFHLLRSAYPVTGPTYTLTVSVTPEGAGSTAGSGSYYENETVLLSAKAHAGYEFVNWTSADGTNLSVMPQFPFQIKENTTITANFREGSGIAQLEANSVSVYPNPFADHIQIDVDNMVGLDEKGMAISVYDMEGRELYKTVSQTGKINLSRLPRGIYNMHVTIGDKQGVYKIVKQ